MNHIPKSNASDRGEEIWAWLKKWQERLKILIWFITSFIGGVTAAWYAIDNYLSKKVEERIEKIKSYEGSSVTQKVGPQLSAIFDVQCNPGDIPLSFTVNADINNVSPSVRISSKHGNGFRLDIANLAGAQTHLPGDITVAAQCLATGDKKKTK